GPCWGERLLPPLHVSRKAANCGPRSSDQSRGWSRRSAVQLAGVDPAVTGRQPADRLVDGGEHGGELVAPYDGPLLATVQFDPGLGAPPGGPGNQVGDLGPRQRETC